MKNYIKHLMLILLVFLLNMFCVNALPNSLGPIKQVGGRVLDQCGNDSCYGMALKVSETTPVICTKYDKDSPAEANGESGAICSISNDWTEAVRYSVAKIISEAGSGINATALSNQYFAAEMAINRFLYNKDAGGYAVNGQALTSKYRTLYIDYLDKANAAFDSYSTDSKVEIILSSSSLTFTLSGDNYISNTVTVSGVSSYEVTTDVGSVSTSGKSFSIIVPKDKVNQATTVNVKVTSSKELNQARNYNCGSDYQTITPVSLEKITKTGEKTLGGIINPKAQLTIKKVDSKNNLISGATIKVENKDKTYSETFETTSEEIVLTDLEYGEYTITELSAPDKYVLIKNPIKVVLTEENLVESVVLTNQLNKVKISKIDMTNSKFLEGATLEIQDEEGNVVNYCKDEKGNNIECKWITTKEAYEIEGMPNGKYYLVEIIAPEGYVLNTEKVPFTVDGNKSIIEVEMKNELEVEVPNTLSGRSALLLTIAMFDIALGIGIITYVKKNRFKEQ